MGYYISGFVLMPNHIHFMIYIPENGSLQKRIGTMKRFMSYEIIKRLHEQNKTELIDILSKHVNITDTGKGQKHDVFIKSFDAKPVYYRKFAEQKLSYMHENPIKGKWQLSPDYITYPWSSASYYEINRTTFDFLTHYIDLL